MLQYWHLLKTAGQDYKLSILTFIQTLAQRKVNVLFFIVYFKLYLFVKYYTFVEGLYEILQSSKKIHCTEAHNTKYLCVCGQEDKSFIATNKTSQKKAIHQTKITLTDYTDKW